MVDRGAEDRQTQRHVDPSLEIEQLERNVPLVVIHADDRVESLLPHRHVKQGVGGERAFDGHSTALRPLDRRPDFPDLLISEEAVFPGMRIETGNRDTRIIP